MTIDHYAEAERLLAEARVVRLRFAAEAEGRIVCWFQGRSRRSPVFRGMPPTEAELRDLGLLDDDKDS